MSDSTPPTPQTADPVDRLRRLRRVADQQASMHAILRDQYRTANFYLTFASLIPTAALLCFALAPDDLVRDTLGMSPNVFKLLNTFVAFCAFICVLVQLVWKPDSRAEGHGHAVDHYTNAKYDVDRLLESPESVDYSQARFVEERYLDKRSLPTIPDAKFNRLKQRHLRKVDLSKRLDADPWMRLPRLPWEKPTSKARND
jgi:hypothetical protein